MSAPRGFGARGDLRVANLRFPLSNHRSKRLHKKLLKRHGVQERRKPAIFQVAGSFVVHPALRAEINRLVSGRPL